MKITITFTLVFFISLSGISIAQNDDSLTALYTKIDNYLKAGTENGFAGECSRNIKNTFYLR